MFLIIALIGLLAARPAGALQAAAGKVDITPILGVEHVYMAGFGSMGRRPTGVHDPLEARILLLSDGRLKVGIVSLDLIGFFRRQVQELRRLSGFDKPGAFLFVAATHTHSGPDTLGLWGPWPGVSGVDGRYLARIEKAIAAELARLEKRMVVVGVVGAQGALDPRGLCRDSRDPVVIDPRIAVLGLRTRTGKSVATVVNWSCHPEVLGPHNLELTADYPAYVCRDLEAWMGGTCVYLSGAIGGLLTPDKKKGADDWSEAARIGGAVARKARRLLKKPDFAVSSARLSAASKVVSLPVENSRYLLMLSHLVFGHRILDGSGAPLAPWRRWAIPLERLLGLLSESSLPWVRTEVAELSIGKAAILGIPGEIFPELVIGGYDGRYAFGHPLIAPGNLNPPDLSRAPKPPYLQSFLGVPVTMVVGLANDEIGYIIPGYDFKIRSNALMLPRLPGHYEETNSIGPSATGAILDAARELFKRPRR
jgi:hypothetical protein